MNARLRPVGLGSSLRLAALGLFVVGSSLAAVPSAMASSGSSTIAAPATATSAVTVSALAGATGFLGIIPGGNGHGRITSQPAGIDCTITATDVIGPCQSFFPAGITVKLDVRAAADSKFQGWRGTPGCGKAPNVLIVAGSNIACQPGLSLKF